MSWSLKSSNSSPSNSSCSSSSSDTDPFFLIEVIFSKGGFLEGELNLGNILSELPIDF